MRYGLGFVAGHQPPTYTYNTRSLNTANSNTYTFTGLSIGTADTSRFVIISIVSRMGNTGVDITGVTIGGNAATQLAYIRGTPASNPATAIYGLLVPTGTTANVIVSVNSVGASSCAVASYSIYNLNSTTPFSTATSSASPISLNANTLKDSIAISVGAESGASQTFTWSGATERWDEQVEALSLFWTGADDIMTSNETPRTFSSTISGAPTIGQTGCLVVMR